MQTLLIKLSVLLVKMKSVGWGLDIWLAGQSRIMRQEVLWQPWLLRVGS